MMTKGAMLGAAGLLTLVLGGVARAEECKPAHTFQTVSPGKLTVSIYAYPPFTITSQDGKISGIDSDIVTAIAKKNCLEVVPMIVEAAATIQGVISGKADVAVGDWDRTEARSKVLGISVPTYLDPMAVISKDGVDTIDGLSGKRVGSVTGFNWTAELQKLLGTQFKLYPSDLAMIQDLDAGRIDVGLDGYAPPVLAQKNGQLAGFKIKIIKSDERVGAARRPPQSGILYTKGNTALGEAIDDTISDLHKSGTLAKWITDAGFDAGLTDVGEPRLIK